MIKFFKRLWISLFHKQMVRKYKNGVSESTKRTAEQLHRAVIHGEILEAQNVSKVLRQHACNHRKGGAWGDWNNGDSNEASVFKHTFPWGDTWIICLRCGRKWKPGDFDYEWAMKLITRNVKSTSSQFMGVDTAYARELTRHS